MDSRIDRHARIRQAQNSNEAERRSALAKDVSFARKCRMEEFHLTRERFVLHPSRPFPEEQEATTRDQ